MPRPLSQQARRKALEATQELVAECGIDGFTVDGVARRSGVAKTTLYRHWRSGNELLVDAIGCRIEHLPVPDTGALATDLTQLFTTLVDRVADQGNRRLMLDLLSAAANDPELHQLKESMLAERTRPDRKVVEQAISRGEIPPIDLVLATVLIQGPLMARMLLSSQPISAREVPILAAHIARSLGATNSG